MSSAQIGSLAAIVAGTAGNTPLPTGAVSFLDGTTVIGTRNLNSAVPRPRHPQLIRRVQRRLSVPAETSACPHPSAAQAYVLNATVVPSGSLVYLTLWPDGETQPYVSTLNADEAAITSNLAIVPTTNGKIDAFSSNPTQLILDISSYFAP